MSILYIAFAPLFFITLYKRMKCLWIAVQVKNYGKVKVELLLLSLIIIVGIIVSAIVQALTK